MLKNTNMSTQYSFVTSKTKVEKGSVLEVTQNNFFFIKKNYHCLNFNEKIHVIHNNIKGFFISLFL